MDPLWKHHAASLHAPVAQTEEHLLSKEAVLVQLHSGADEIHRSHQASYSTIQSWQRVYNLSSEIDECRPFK